SVKSRRASPGSALRRGGDSRTPRGGAAPAPPRPPPPLLFPPRGDKPLRRPFLLAWRAPEPASVGSGGPSYSPLLPSGLFLAPPLAAVGLLHLPALVGGVSALAADALVGTRQVGLDVGPVRGRLPHERRGLRFGVLTLRGLRRLHRLGTAGDGGDPGPAGGRR